MYRCSSVSVAGVWFVPGVAGGLCLPLLVTVIITLFSSYDGGVNRLSTSCFAIAPRILRTMNNGIPTAVGNGFPRGCFGGGTIMRIAPILG